MEKSGGLRITQVVVTLVGKDEFPVLAYANIVFNNEFMVRKIRVLEGRTHLIVRMPNIKNNYGSWSDVAHPLSPLCRNRIESAILATVESQRSEGINKQENERIQGENKNGDILH